MAMTADRVRLITKARVVVVKVGTQVLADESGRLSSERIATLAEQIDRLAKGGRRVILVSSGAIGAGVVIGLVSSQTSIPPNVDAPYVVYGNN